MIAYLLASGAPDLVAAVRARMGSRLRQGALAIRLDRPEALLLTAPNAIATEGLAIIGEVFRRGATGPLDTIAPTLRDAARVSRGVHLTETCWGPYVACSWQAGDEAVDLVRAPLGELPCYYHGCDRLVVAAPTVALIAAAIDARFAVAPAALCRQLAAFDVRRPETCLAGLRELPGGHRLSVRAGRVDDPVALWTPWTAADRARQINDPVEAQRRVRDAIRMSVAARAGRERILLKLSGGLDSSIVAAALAHGGCAFEALNLVTLDPVGDERVYARMVASALGVRLSERYRDAERIDLTRSEAMALPRPSARSFAQESTRLCAEIAADRGATRIFDGGGGDNVFCSLQSVRPVVDCLRDAAGRSALGPTVASIAAMVQASRWKVLYRGWLQNLRRVTPYRWRTNLRFLSAQACGEASEAALHPWFVPPTGALPGKLAHVALVAQTLCVVEDGATAGQLPLISPLLAQPVVEACLQVPSWLWFGAGLNRATARRAFAADLPAPVLGRRSKAAPDGFLAEIYERNRPLIRTMLCEGALRREGLLDLPAVQAFLDDPAPVRGPDYQRILQLVDAEAWIAARSA